MKINNKTGHPLSRTQEQQILAQHAASLGVPGSGTKRLEELQEMFPEEEVVVTFQELKRLGRNSGWGF